MKKVLVSLLVLAMSYSVSSAKNFADVGLNLDLANVGVDYTQHITDNIGVRVGVSTAWNFVTAATDGGDTLYFPIDVLYNIKGFEVGAGVTVKSTLSAYPISLKAGYNFNFSSVQLGLGAMYTLPYSGNEGLPSAYLAARYRF